MADDEQLMHERGGTFEAYITLQKLAHLLGSVL